MYKRLIILFITVFSSCVFAQEGISYAEANKVTKEYYEQGNWQALIIVGKRAELAGLGFYRLYQRMGVAYFRTGQYFKSEKYLRMALDENTHDPLAKELLYYSIYYQGDAFRASEYRLSLPENERPGSIVPDKKKVEFLYLEAGAKFSSRTDSVGNLIPFTIGIGHKPGPRTRIYQSLSLVNQEYYWGSYSQLTYHLGPQFRLGKNLTLNPSFGLVGLWGSTAWNRSYEYLETSAFPIGPPPAPVRYDTSRISEQNNFSGNLSQIGLILNTGMTWKKGRWEVSPSVAFSHYTNIQNGTANLDQHIETTWNVEGMASGSETIDTSFTTGAVYDTTYWQFQYGVEAAYTLPIMKDGVRLGLKAELATTRSRTYGVLNPWAEVRLGKSVWLKGNYLWANNGAFLLESNASVVNNAIDPVQHKASLMGIIPAGNRVTLFLMYQYEQRKETQYGFPYHFHTGITGIKIRL